MSAKRKSVWSQSPIFPVLALLVSMMAFTSGASFAKQVFPVVGAQGATTLRLVCGALMLLIFLRPWRNLTGKAPVTPVLVYGIAMGAMNLLFYFALSRIPLGIAVALELTGPLTLTIATSRAAADFLWTAVASLGLLLLFPAPGNIHGIDPVGALLALGAGACWALYIVTGKIAGASHGADAPALGMSIGAVLILPVGIAHAGATLVRPAIILAGVALAFLSSALPYSLEIFALRRLPIKTYGTLMSCEPVFGVLAGRLFLQESLTWLQAIAIGLIICAAGGATVTAARTRPLVLPD